MFHVEQKKTHIEVVDHFLTKEKFKIQHTSVPGLLQTKPRPTKEDINKYYKSEKYISHNSRKKGLFFFSSEILCIMLLPYETKGHSSLVAVSWDTGVRKTKFTVVKTEMCLREL